MHPIRLIGLSSSPVLEIGRQSSETLGYVSLVRILLAPELVAYGRDAALISFSDKEWISQFPAKLARSLANSVAVAFHLSTSAGNRGFDRLVRRDFVVEGKRKKPVNFPGEIERPPKLNLIDLN